ncbi:MAG: molybdenum cofactor guanylyltransferase MobA [Rhodoferax sp.]|nr:molybdenum cofactor guanylyltransferase MobA [Rhodoferax sp.]
MAQFDPREVCAVVLAGGMGSRMGGVDKGLQLLAGQPLAGHCVQRLQAQTLGAPGLIAINANRNADLYARWGCPVWADELKGYAGPLAGFETALQYCSSRPAGDAAAPEGYRYLLTVACDTPRFPLDLMDRLAQALEFAAFGSQGADIAVAGARERDDKGQWTLRPQPVFCLLRTTLAPSLQAFLASGGRKVDAWTAQHRTVVVAFDQAQDDPQAFFNANTLAELRSLESTPLRTV